MKLLLCSRRPGMWTSSGALVGGLDLPSSFLNVWDALDRVGHELDEADRGVWQSHVGLLRSLCGKLERRLQDMSVDAVKQAVVDATACVAELAREFAVELPASEPRAPLRCDLSLPFDVELG